MDNYAEEIDLMTDVCMLDVDLPTFLNDYPLSVDRSISSGGGVLVANGSGDTTNIYKSNTVLNEFDHRNETDSVKSHYTNFNSNSNINAAEDANFYLPESIFSNPASEYTVLTPAALPNALSPQQRQFVDAPWHDNFIDVESDFAFFDTVNNASSSTTNELSFLENIVWHAETGNNVDDLLDIVEQSANKASTSSALRDPQQIYEEIYRECEEIESRSDAESPPRFISESEVADGEVIEHYSPASQEDDDDDDEDEDEDSLDETNDDGNTTDTSYSAVGYTTDHSSFARGSKKWGRDAKKSGSDLSFSMKKKGQNRVAASRYRSKKKSERKSIATELKLLTGRNQALRGTVEDLEREVSYLKNFLAEIRQAKKGAISGVSTISKKVDKRSMKKVK